MKRVTSPIKEEKMNRIMDEQKNKHKAIIVL